MKCKVCNDILVSDENYPREVYLGTGICNECFEFLPEHIPNSQIDKFFITLKEKNEKYDNM